MAAPARTKRSLVIITSRRSRLLDATLASVAEQTVRFDEVIVVDNADDLPTDQTTASWASRLPVRRLVEPHRGYSLARNVGLRAACGEHVYFLDDDCVADPDWAEVVAQPLALGEADLVGGARRAAEPTLAHRLEYLSTDGPSLSPRLPRGPAHHLSTSNLVMRREVVDAVGFFTEGLVMCEDRDFSLRARRAGFRLLFEPAARVTHHSPIGGLRGYLLKMRHYGEGTSQHFLRWPQDEPLARLFPRRPVLRALALPVLAALGTAYLVRGNLPHRPDVLKLLPLLALGQVFWHLGGLDATLAGRQPRPELGDGTEPR